jgi:hypothetical protein
MLPSESPEGEAEVLCNGRLARVWAWLLVTFPRTGVDTLCIRYDFYFHRRFSPYSAE